MLYNQVLPSSADAAVKMSCFGRFENACSKKGVFNHFLHGSI
jgi:hypothetical protein